MASPGRSPVRSSASKQRRGAHRGYRPAAPAGQQRTVTASKDPGRRPSPTLRRRSGDQPFGTLKAVVSLERSWPIRQRQQILKPHRPPPTKDHLRFEVGRVHLTDELPAPPTWWHHTQRTCFIPPHRHDLDDPVLAGRDHGSDRAVLRAEARPRASVDADTEFRLPSSVTSIDATSPNSRSPTTCGLSTACAESISSSFDGRTMVASYQGTGAVAVQGRGGRHLAGSEQRPLWEREPPDLAGQLRKAPSVPTLVFVAVPEGKAVKNRLHLDVRPVDSSHEAEVERLIGLGARRADVGQGEEGGFDDELGQVVRRVGPPRAPATVVGLGGDDLIRPSWPGDRPVSAQCPAP
jgi:hypothetical protein